MATTAASGRRSVNLAAASAPAVAVSVAANSGNQAFEYGGATVMMIDASNVGGALAPARSREDEKVLHELSKTWNTFF